MYCHQATPHYLLNKQLEFPNEYRHRDLTKHLNEVDILSLRKCLGECVTLTGCIINPLNMCWWIFLEVSKDVLRAHVIDTRHVNCLQTQPRYGLAKQKRNRKYRQGLRDSIWLKKKDCRLLTFLHHVFIQQNGALRAALLTTEVETLRPLLFPFDGFLIN